MILLLFGKINVFLTFMDIYTKNRQKKFNFVLTFELKLCIIKIQYQFNKKLKDITLFIY